jgi:hypothetical protein
VHWEKFGPIFFGPLDGEPPTGWFDAPGGEYRTCYQSLSAFGAFAETMLRSLTPAYRVLGKTDLAARSIATIRLERSLKVARLHGDGLARLGVTATTTTGPYPPCRLLSLGLWSHRLELDGIEYRTRHDDDELSIAFFDRAADALTAESTRSLAGDVGFLKEVTDRYDVGL